MTKVNWITQKVREWSKILLQVSFDDRTKSHIVLISPLNPVCPQKWTEHNLLFYPEVALISEQFANRTYKDSNFCWISLHLFCCEPKPFSLQIWKISAVCCSYPATLPSKMPRALALMQTNNGVLGFRGCVFWMRISGSGVRMSRRVVFRLQGCVCHPPPLGQLELLSILHENEGDGLWRALRIL